MAHRAPEAHRHGRLHQRVLHAHRGHFVGLVEGAFGGGLVDTHARHITQRPAGLARRRLHPGHQRHGCHARGVARHDLRHDGLAGGVVGPGNDLACGIQPGLEARQRRRSVEVVRGVLLAAPDHLHRCAGHGLRDERCLGHKVHVQPAPEAAAQQLHLHVHLVLGQAQGLGRNRARDVGHLGRSPDRGRAVLDEHGAIDGLQRGVRQVRRAVLGADGLGRTGQRGLGVAAREVSEAFVAVQCGSEGLHQACAGDGCHRASVPGDGDFLDRLHSLPGKVRDHSHAAGAAGLLRLERQHLAHARHLGCGGAVMRGHAAAQRRAHQHAGIAQAGGQHVDAKARAAVDLARRFQARQGLADEFEGGRILEHRLLGQGQRRGLRGQIAEAHMPTRRVPQHTRADLHLGRRYAPTCASRGHQHRARRSAGLAHRQPQVLDAR